MSETPRDPPRLGPFDIACVVVGGIIGVGIFFAPATVAALVDSPAQLLTAWGIGGAIALAGALVFAELAARVPGHGGPFRYIETAFGAPLAFLYGWANWLVIQAGALGVIALIFADNMLFAARGVRGANPTVSVVLALVAIVGFTGLNLCGLRAGQRTQNAITVLKVAIVFGLAAMIALVADGSRPAPEATVPTETQGWTNALVAAMLPVLFSFGGWQQGSFLAGAARRPRDVAWGIVAGVVVVVVAYLALNLAYLSVLGLDGVAAAQDTIAAVATEHALRPYGIGDVAARVVAGMIAISALGILNTVCLAPPYVLKAMADRGVFYRGFGRMHARFHCPSQAILAQGLWGALLLVLAHVAFGEGTLGFLLEGVVFVDWIFYGLAGVALVVLQRRGGGGLRLPGGALIPVSFATAAFAVTVGAIRVAPRASLAGLGVCAVGLVAYLAFRRAEARAR